jgi:hypothetical protein
MAGIVYAIARRDIIEDSSQPALVFFLSVFGVGLFSYYQGRSHDHCLSFVSYPAIILLTICTDNLLERCNKRTGIVKSVSAIALLSVFIVSTLAFVRVAPTFYAIFKARLGATVSDITSQVAKDAGFISRMVYPGEKVLMLSNLSGIYHLVSETVCPINIPGPAELFLADDYKKILLFMNSSQPGKIIVDSNFVYDRADLDNPYKEKLWATLRFRYKEVAKSPQSNLAVYVLK